MARRYPLRWRMLAACSAVVLLLGVIITRITAPTPVEQVRTLPPFARDSAYLWQRQWNAEVLAAVAHPGAVRELRVLALEVDARGGMQRIAVDLAALAQGPARVVPVVRIDGRQPPLDSAVLRRELQGLLEQWRKAGLTVDLLELDHDCARSILGGYANWIVQLRETWEGGPGIAITGLPDWLHSPELALLRAAVDEFTLQVHAANDPAAGLFDLQQALAWVRRLDTLSNDPFHVALPTYGARIRGQLHWALPEEVSILLAEWQREQPQHLRGVRFFRLPVAGDGNTWSAATLDAVIENRIPQPALRLEQRVGPSGAIDLLVHNPTEFDAALPQRILIPALCQGDGATGYAFLREQEHSVLEALEQDRLAPNRRRTLGWIRCPQSVEIRLDAS